MAAAFGENFIETAVKYEMAATATGKPEATGYPAGEGICGSLFCFIRKPYPCKTKGFGGQLHCGGEKTAHKPLPQAEDQKASRGARYAVCGKSAVSA